MSKLSEDPNAAQSLTITPYAKLNNIAMKSQLTVPQIGVC